MKIYLVKAEEWGDPSYRYTLAAYSTQEKAEYRVLMEYGMLAAAINIEKEIGPFWVLRSKPVRAENWFIEEYELDSGEELP